MRTLLFLTIMTLCAQQAFAQYLSPQQDPPGVDWKCIETPHYEVVFPADIARDAQRVANTLEHLYLPVAKTLEIEPRKITVILTNNTTQANGFVTLAPRRSEWFGTPPQYGLLGTNEWYTLLAVHEMRHVAQFDKLNAGFTEGVYWLFGESAWSFLSFWSVPGWVWEGDAVGTETALTSGGRGRMPEFNRDIRALLLSGERYSYYKAYLGSFKDWYPSIYHLGALLTTHIKRAYGPARFSEIMRRSANWSFLPFSWSMMSNSEIDKTSVEVYEETMDELTALWKKQEAALVLTRGTVKNTQPRDCWTNYLYPQYLADGSIVAQKWGMDDMYTLVRIDARGEESDLCLAALYDNPMSVRGTKIVWNEPVADLRWGKRDFTRLCVYDVATGEKSVLVPETKLFSPSLSPDMTTVAAVEFTASRECAIVLLDAGSGRELRRLPNPDGDFLQTPSWSPDGASIVAVAVSISKGKAVKRFDLASGAEEALLPYGREDVSLPLLHGARLYYQSPLSGIDNVYVMDLASKRRRQVTSARFGASSPCLSPDGRTMLYTNYTTEGFDIEETAADSAAWKTVEEIQDGSIRYYEPLVAMEQGRDITADIPRRDWEVRDYSALANLFNVHSWGILPGSTDESVSLTLSSLNRMNTFGADVGYEYDFNEKTGFFNAGASYAGLFPILGASGQTGRRSMTYTDSWGTKQTTSWQEKAARLGFSIPMNFTKGLYHVSATAGASVSRVEVTGKTVLEAMEINNGVFTPVTYQADFSAGMQWIRDIHPRWGQFVSLSFSHAPFRSDDYKGSLLSALGTFYFPGSLPSHSIWTQVGYERQHAVNYQFSSRMRFPRGYDAVYHESLFKASANYAFPIWYPDWHIWSVLNIQRLRANIFYDFAEGHDGSHMRRYHSGGAELVTDVNLFSLPFLMDLGVRASWLSTQKKWVTEFVFGSGI